MAVLGGVIAMLSACGEPPDHAKPPSGPVLDGTYVPVSAGGAAGFRALTLHASGRYSSSEATCAAHPCVSRGTFTFDGAHSLVLVDARSGAKRRIAVDALASDAGSSAANVHGASVVTPRDAPLVSGGGGAPLVSGGGAPLVSRPAAGGAREVAARATLDGVAMRRRAAPASEPPTVIVSPNTDPKLAADWQTSFAHPREWPTMLGASQVLQLYEADIAAVVAASPGLVPMLQARGLEVSIEASPLMSDACIDAGFPEDGSADDREQFVATYTAKLMTADLQPIYDAGGAVAYVALDSDGIEPVTTTGPKNHCRFSIDEASRSQAYFLAAMATAHPEIKFGLIANFPAYDYVGTTCYWNDATKCDRPFAGSDYADVLDTQMTIVQAAGQSLTFLHVDNPYNYLTGHPNVDDVFNDRIVTLRDQAIGYGLRFGVILNSEEEGVADRAQADQQYHDDSVAYANLVAGSDLGSEEDVIVESWYHYPTNVLPESTPNTFAATANDTIAAFLATSGR